MGWFENYFEFDRYGTNMKTEVLAGVTTFMTMAYILFVNPAILSDAMGKEAFNSLVAVTALAAGFATILMGLYAKKPFALAPGMGLNAYFAYSVVLGMGYDWHVALAAVFVEGLIFIALSVTKVRSAIIHAIPLSQKYAVGAGIGLFLTLIGLNDVGLLTAFVQDGVLKFTGLNATALASKQILLFFFGLFLTAVLIALRIKGALLISIITTSVLGWITGAAPWPDQIFSTPDISYTFMKMDLPGLLNVGAIGVVFAFFMVDFFDTLGTVTGLSAKAGFITRDGKIPDAEKVLLTDAVGTTVGAILGTSTVTTYIESAAGIEEGGRTGMTALVTGLLFLVIGLFIAPLAQAIPAFATAPALVIVGYYMLSAIKEVDFTDHTEAIPAFLVLITIPYTYSIADGIGMGFISYTLIKLFSGRGKEVHPLMYVLALVFIAYFAYLGGVI
ncbi:NCS2 family permease [Thermococcus sp. GR7]|uniref:NCS2 family permease n=1 Tax=unclassified Thermococcus TaxID=2627626 RepID=UPI00142FD76A|nr:MULTISPECIES: NCS2 family permease [unclassified Thermococcus]NJE47203.1 NCS2 family permease [Thermococcus sp. GR7]NJE77972.1 NCS2 family permease [Thermococcus sp. GR4]NJF22911.1 NCS2 family permease [Thermococcus sp. GR5]